MSDQIKQAALAVDDDLQRIRQEMHKKPYTRYDTEWTRSFLRGELEATIAMDQSEGEWTFHESTGGFWLEGRWAERKGRCLMLRTDIDALPGIVEATGLEYASQIEGQMHACGHDAHSATLTAAVMAITQEWVPAPNCSRVIFAYEDAEENPGASPHPEPGAHFLIEDGVLDGVDEAVGLHYWVAPPEDSSGEAGVFSSRAAWVFANSRRFEFSIESPGGHAAHPEDGSSAADIELDVRLALRGADRQILGAFEPCALTITYAHTGDSDATNVRPGSARVMGNARTFLSPEREAWFLDRLKERVEGVVARYPDATVEFKLGASHQAFENDPNHFSKVRDILESAGHTVGIIEPNLGGESWGRFVQEYGGKRVPGSFWFLGARQKGSGGHHSNTFNPDPAVFKLGVEFWLRILAVG